MTADFRLVVKQSPFKGRESGVMSPYLNSILFPPLILELEFNHPQSFRKLQSYNIVCSITLYPIDRSENLTVLENSYYFKTRYMGNLAGDTITTGKVLFDQDQTPKIFFLFNDLNIKVEGEYIFSCTAIDMDKSEMASVDTKPFFISLRSKYIKPNIKTIVSKYLEDQL
ncbi:hypothetical protein HDV06_000016 [Boothiomyces sp. JEL0866]|nr:hypothetical protein HDV06_000016 [Boothiomyces sp. JEL0866]